MREIVRSSLRYASTSAGLPLKEIEYVLTQITVPGPYSDWSMRKCVVL